MTLAAHNAAWAAAVVGVLIAGALLSASVVRWSDRRRRRRALPPWIEPVVRRRPR